MRYLFGFLCVCALVGTLPQSASAQDAEEGTISEPNLEQPAAPSSEAAPEEPALQLKLDSAGVDVGPSPPRTADEYALDKMKIRVKRAKIGLGVSAASLAAGGVLVGVALPNLSCEEPAGSSNSCPIPGWSLPVFVMGVTLAAGGVLGLISTGILLGVRKRKLRRYQDALYRAPRRVDWNPARSQLVF